MEDIDEIRSKPADNNKNNINGKFTEHATETESKEKKKKKKNKEEEKSKKKKHKKKDDEKIQTIAPKFVAPDSKRSKE